MKTKSIKNTILPKYFRKDNSLHTIEIHGKEWFDKVNGNSYNSVQVVVNRNLKNEFRFSIPFQYGYGNYFEQSAFEALVKAGAMSDRFSYRNRRDSGKLKVESFKDENCLQRDVKSHGSAYQTI